MGGKKDKTEVFQQPERWSGEFSHDANGCSHVRARIPSSLQELLSWAFKLT